MTKFIEAKFKLLLPGRTDEKLYTISDWPESPGYKAMNEKLKPFLLETLEHVNVWANFKEVDDFDIRDLFVGETSAYGRLPRNEMATAHYRRAAMEGMTPGFPATKDPETLAAVYGPAILFDRKVWS